MKILKSLYFCLKSGLIALIGGGLFLTYLMILALAVYEFDVFKELLSAHFFFLYGMMPILSIKYLVVLVLILYFVIGFLIGLLLVMAEKGIKELLGLIGKKREADQIILSIAKIAKSSLLAFLFFGYLFILLALLSFLRY